MPVSDASKEKRAVISVWLDLETIAEIDERVAEIQKGKREKIHRSDVIREVLDEWAAGRRGRQGNEP